MDGILHHHAINFEMNMESEINKSFLVVIRDAGSCGHGVRFVSSFFHNCKGIDLALFHVMTTSLAWDSVDSPWNKDNDDFVLMPLDIQKAFSSCYQLLCSRGYQEKQITKIVRRKRRSFIQDIIDEVDKGTHDAVLMGKKSTSFLEDIICGNEGHEILAKEISAPVWFCRDPEEGRRNVLLCLDGSSADERVADHVGYILQGEDQHDVTLLHVDKGQKRDTEKMFADATAMLTSYGVDQERIHPLSTRAMRVSRTILERADQGKFAVVAMGSIGRTAHKNLCQKMIGSKCQNIFNAINKAALWVVP